MLLSRGQFMALLMAATSGNLLAEPQPSSVPLPSAVDPWGFRALAGYSRFYGDLTDARSSPTAMGSFRRMQGEERRRWGIGFDYLKTSVRHDEQYFPHPEHTELAISCVLIMPIVCESAGNFETCAGLGLGTVNVNSKDVRQDYGSWHYEVSGRWFFHQHWALTAFTKYVGWVEQRNFGVDSEFAFLTYGAGVGYAY